MRNYIYVLTIEPPEHLSTQDRDAYINSELAKLKETGFPSYGKCLPNGLRTVASMENGSVRVIYESDSKFQAPEGFNARLDKKSLGGNSKQSNDGEKKSEKVDKK